MLCQLPQGFVRFGYLLEIDIWLFGLASISILLDPDIEKHAPALLLA
jgi:hypothetical protein